jgi:hypothetical protein
VGLSPALFGIIFQYCGQLQSLTMHCVTDDDVFVIVSSCPNLRRLAVNHDSICECACMLTANGAAALARSCPHLVSLSLSGFPSAGSPAEQVLGLLEAGCVARCVSV